MPSDNRYGLDSTEDAVNTLGVVWSGNENDHYILNYKKRHKTMKNLVSSWKCRYLSLKDKVTVINSIAISPLLYLKSIIHVTCRVIQEVKHIVTDFIWNGKPPKTAYNVMMQNIENGGIKLTDSESKMKSLKLTMAERTHARVFTTTNHSCQQCVTVNSYNQTCFMQTPVYRPRAGIVIELIATARRSCAWVLTTTEHFVNSYNQLPFFRPSLIGTNKTTEPTLFR